MTVVGAAQPQDPEQALASSPWSSAGASVSSSYSVAFAGGRGVAAAGNKLPATNCGAAERAPAERASSRRKGGRHIACSTGVAKGFPMFAPLDSARRFDRREHLPATSVRRRSRRTTPRCAKGLDWRLHSLATARSYVALDVTAPAAVHRDRSDGDLRRGEDPATIPPGSARQCTVPKLERTARSGQAGIGVWGSNPSTASRAGGVAI